MIKQINNRLQKLREKLALAEIDAILISQPENREYLSGFRGTAGYLLITSAEAVLATDFRYIEQATEQATCYKVFKITGSMQEWLVKLLGDLNIKSLGFESEHVTYSLYNQLSELLKKEKPSLKLTPANGIVESLRAIKEPEEIKLINQAIKISDEALNYIEDAIDTGMTEKEVAWK
jgi:Xaa-Pro aminopeptidase